MEVASDALERALAELARASGFRLEQHDVMLRGQCPSCALAADGNEEGVRA